MKPFQLLSVLIIVLLSACGEENIYTSLEAFCTIKPEGWECEIIENDFDENDIPKNTKDPVAIIKYRNINREFSGLSQDVNPSLILDIYPIEEKNELIELIISQMMFSWCIPSYYGESEEFFVLSSPCFINNGIFTEEADSCILDLHKSLENILIRKDYNLK